MALRPTRGRHRRTAAPCVDIAHASLWPRRAYDADSRRRRPAIIAAVARVHDHDLLQSAGMAVGRSATDYAEVLVVTRSAILLATARASGRTRHNPAPGIIDVMPSSA